VTFLIEAYLSYGHVGKLLGPKHRIALPYFLTFTQTWIYRVIDSHALYTQPGAMSGIFSRSLSAQARNFFTAWM
jgi:hypothetical protein